jgi:hypothetical protein
MYLIPCFIAAQRLGLRASNVNAAGTERAANVNAVERA